MTTKPEKFLQITQKALKSPNFELRIPDYLLFWDSMSETPENTLQFIIELIHHLILSEISKKSSKAIFLENILSTIIMSIFSKKPKQFHQDLDKSHLSQLRELEKEWLAHSKSPKNPYSIEIIKGFFSLLLRNEEKEFLKGIVDQLCRIPIEAKAFLKVNGLSNINEVFTEAELGKFYKELLEYFNRIEVYQKNNYQDSLPFYSMLNQDRLEMMDTGELAYLYEGFISYLNECKAKDSIHEIIFQTLLENLKFIPYIAKKYPKKAEEIALISLHLIKNIFIFIPLTKNSFKTFNIQDILKAFITRIDIFRRWPYPVGLLASELLNLLFSESKTLGNAFRYKIREDIPKIDFLYYNDKKEDQEPLHQAYCITEDQEASIVGGILNQNALKFESFKHSLDAHKLRLLIIAYILDLQEDISKEFLKHLARVNDRDVFLIYCRILNIIEKCEELDSYVDIKNIEEKAFGEIVKEIENMSADSAENPEFLSVLLGENQAFIPKYPDIVLKSLTTMANNMKRNSIFAGKGNLEMSSHLESYSYSLKIIEILERIKHMNLPLHQEPFKLCVFGGDQDFQSILQDLGGIFKKNSKLFENIDFRIYIIPTKSNTLARFLASQDPWYSQHIYLPFVNDILIPKLEGVDSNGPNLTGNSAIGRNETLNFHIDKQLLPFEMKENLIQSYIREANRMLHLKTYEVLCYREVHNEKEKVPDNRIFFGMYVEIGRNVEAFKVKSGKKHLIDDTVYDLKEKGLFKYTYLDVEIETFGLDFLNNLYDPESLKIRLSNMKINNLYKEGFEGNLPIPNADWLELSYIDYENSRQEDYSMKKKNLFKKHTNEQMQNAFFSLHTSLSVAKVVVKDVGNKPFDLVVDGKLYGSYAHVVIQPLYSSGNENKNQLTLPIMTFLPLNL